ncbi:MAG: hypothetical protein JKY08_04175 [Flavobacteriaceae bacterium]|nr:hypothetical protein [Flavobacteriaceae bacterium]
MKKSVIEPANELSEKLFEIPEIVTAFANKETEIFNKWITWLQDLEAVFKKYNFTECAEIAGYRAAVLASSQSFDVKRVKKRKLREQVALESVQPVQQILSDRSNLLLDKIEQVRTLVKQILIPAKDAGMIKYDSKMDDTLFMENLLIQFKAHEKVRPSINNAIALLGKYDVIRILTEEIEY